MMILNQLVVKSTYTVVMDDFNVKIKSVERDTLLASVTTGGRHVPRSGIRYDYSAVLQGDSNAHTEKVAGRDRRQDRTTWNSYAGRVAISQ